MALDVGSVDVVATTSPPRRRRSTHLRRRLAVADGVAGAAGGIVGGWLGGGSAVELVGLGVILGVGWPAAAFLGGLYALAGLRTWASGVGETPKLLLTCLMVSWPIFGLHHMLGLPYPAWGAATATFGVAVIAAVARAVARGEAHRNSPLRQRTLIIGSGDVAQLLVDRVNNHSELALEPPRRPSAAGAAAARSPSIGDDVFIGPNAVLFGGVQIGDRGQIGAGSVVTSSFGDDVVVTGVPARIIRRREP